MYLIVTAAWLTAFAGNVMAHQTSGMDTGFGLGGPPPASVTMAPVDGDSMGATPAANISDTIDDDRPAADIAGDPLADQEGEPGAQDLTALHQKLGAAGH